MNQDYCSIQNRATDCIKSSIFDKTDIIKARNIIFGKKLVTEKLEILYLEENWDNFNFHFSIKQFSPRY